MTEYCRSQHPGATWFFTVSLTERFDVLRTVFADVKRKHPSKINEAVILPNHLH